MKLVLATNHLGLGGSESYLLTVAEQLDRLGHEVVLFAPEGGPGMLLAGERGLEAVDAAGLPADCDAALVQDRGVCFQMADRYPEVPQLFVAHSETFDLQAPPQLPGMVSAVVALNDRVAARLRSFAVEAEVVRLTQPIDTERFASHSSLPKVPRQALLLSNTPHVDRIELLESACRQAGLTLRQLGGRDGQSSDPRQALNDADVVIGYGRSILEAMSCGRAAYVYDWNGGDGWVTPESYPAIEADGIAGRSGRVALGERELAADLGRYDAAMGPVNHDLVMGNHRANVHAQQLVELFRRLASPGERPQAPLQEMARLVRLEWRARAEVHALGQEIGHLRVLLRKGDEQLRQAKHVAHQEAVAAANEMSERIHLYEESLSWRLTRPLRGLSGALARLRRR